MDILSIDKEKVINTYKQGSEKEKKVLELLFGVETFRPKNVMERVKTFEDACRELGKDHPFVLAYQNTNLRNKEVADDNKDVIAYLKLRIIAAALNEGWTPQFVKDKYRYSPYFCLYTDKEIIRMLKEQKSRVFYRSSSAANAYSGVSCVGAYGDSAYVYSSIGSRLAFKTKELAEYAGKQFTELYVDYLLNTNNA